MRAVIQRVLEASVTVDGKVVGSIDGPGLVVLVGVTHSDGPREVAWMARNCSFSEFLFSDDRFTLSSFNASPHLDDESLLTYR